MEVREGAKVAAGIVHGCPLTQAADSEEMDLRWSENSASKLLGVGAQKIAILLASPLYFYTSHVIGVGGTGSHFDNLLEMHSGNYRKWIFGRKIFV
jgi:hypothetical protein